MAPEAFCVFRDASTRARLMIVVAPDYDAVCPGSRALHRPKAALAHSGLLIHSASRTPTRTRAQRDFDSALTVDPVGSQRF
jgi:hypothetical protein